MEIKNRKLIYDGFFKVEQVTIDQQGKLLERDIITNKNAVAALVYNTETNQFLLTEQLRVPARKKLIEIVAGLIDKPDEAPEEAIKREINEEIGFAVDSLEFISTFYSTPGSYSEKVWLYYAKVSKQISRGGGLAEEDEEIKTVAFSREKLLDCPFEDAKTLIAKFWVMAGNGN